jgi:predicted signal transduction protein with EAL and GGDEF domain
LIGNALELGEFELWCHPHVAARDGSIACVQAAVRWRRQDGGLAPQAAIAGALSGHAAQELFILHMVCDALGALRMWSAEGFELNLVLALPLPRERLAEAALCAAVDGLLAQAGIASQRLQLQAGDHGGCCEVADLLDWLRVRDAGCAQAAGEFIATPQPAHVLPVALRRWQASYSVMSAAEAFS